MTTTQNSPRTEPRLADGMDVADEIEVGPEDRSRLLKTKLDRVVDRLRRPRSAGTGDDEPGLLDAPIVVPTIDHTTTDHQLSGFDLRSVAKFATKFFGAVVAMIFAAVVVVWLLASVLGLVSAFEEFMDGIGFTNFHLLSVEFLFGLALLALVFAAFMVAMTVVAAGLYNVLASHGGGVTIFVSATPPDAPSAELTASTTASNGAAKNGAAKNGAAKNGAKSNGRAAAANGARPAPLRRVSAAAARSGARLRRNGPSEVA